MLELASEDHEINQKIFINSCKTGRDESEVPNKERVMPNIKL